MDRRLIDGLLRAGRAEDITLRTGVGQMLAQRGIGLRRGTRLVLHESDRARIRDILTESGISPDLKPGALGEMDRIAAAAHAPDEKLAGQRAGGDTVLYAHLPCRSLRLDGEDYRWPMGHCGRGPAEDLARLDRRRHRAVIMIENLAVLWALHRWPWPLPEICLDAVVLFRGSPQEPPGPVRDLIRLLDLPVWVAGDMDPAGLGIAMRMPGYAGLIRPPDDDLEHVLRLAGNGTLFGDQKRQWGRVLSECPDPDIRSAFRIMEGQGRGITQEAMIAFWSRGTAHH